MRGARYLLRFDDICPTQNWRNWDRLEAVLVEHDVKPILAVVPDNRDPELQVTAPLPDFWARVRSWQSQGWSIALHGYQHAYTSNDAGLLALNYRSEFAGIAVDDQRDKLHAAIRIFEANGVHVDAWVAPGHSFDRNTIESLRELGVTTISDGFSYRPFRRFGCTWVPQQLWRMRSMPAGVWTVCIHPNTMNDKSIDKFESDVARFSSRIVSLDSVLGAASNAAPYSAIDAGMEAIWRRLLHLKRSLS